MKVHKKDVYESSKFLFICLKLLGLAPYKINRKIRAIEVNSFNYLELAVAMIVWIFYIWVQHESLHLEYSYNGVQSSLVDRIWKYQYVAQHVFAILVLLHNFFKRNRIESFLKLMDDFDKDLQRLNWKIQVVNFSTTPVMILFVFTSVYIVTQMFVGTYVIDFFEGNPEAYSFKYIMNMFAYMQLIVFYLMISLQFILSAHHVNTRLNALRNNMT